MLESKQEWRSRFRRARAELTSGFRDSAASALISVVSDLDLGEVVAAYVPVGSEPGLVLPYPVLLPVTPPAPGPLDWAWSGDFQPGPFGLLEPAGPRLGANALSAASTVLLPALGVSRGGVRLGRGAGYYDRSLQAGGISGGGHAGGGTAGAGDAVGAGAVDAGSAGAGAGAGGGPRLIAVVYDHELVDFLPSEPTDVPVHAALTPSGLVEF